VSPTRRLVPRSRNSPASGHLPHKDGRFCDGSPSLIAGLRTPPARARWFLGGISGYACAGLAVPTGTTCRIPSTRREASPSHFSDGALSRVLTPSHPASWSSRSRRPSKISLAPELTLRLGILALAFQGRLELDRRHEERAGLGDGSELAVPSGLEVRPGKPCRPDGNVPTPSDQESIGRTTPSPERCEGSHRLSAVTDPRQGLAQVPIPSARTC